jgi:hypothetical protein
MILKHLLLSGFCTQMVANRSPEEQAASGGTSVAELTAELHKTEAVLSRTVAENKQLLRTVAALKQHRLAAGPDAARLAASQLREAVAGHTEGSLEDSVAVVQRAMVEEKAAADRELERAERRHAELLASIRAAQASLDSPAPTRLEQAERTHSELVARIHTLQHELESGVAGAGPGPGDDGGGQAVAQELANADARHRALVATVARLERQVARLPPGAAIGRAESSRAARKQGLSQLPKRVSGAKVGMASRAQGAVLKAGVGLKAATVQDSLPKAVLATTAKALTAAEFELGAAATTAKAAVKRKESAQGRIRHGSEVSNHPAAAAERAKAAGGGGEALERKGSRPTYETEGRIARLLAEAKR